MNDIPISAPDTDDGKVIHYNVNRILYEADQKKAEEAKKNDVEENKAKSGDQSKRHTPDQAALSDLAKDAKRKGDRALATPAGFRVEWTVIPAGVRIRGYIRSS